MKAKKSKKNITNRYKKYAWLLDIARSKKIFTKAQVDKLWSENSDINPNEDEIIPPRTFNRYIHKIEDLFGVSIEFSHITNTYTYEDLAEGDDDPAAVLRNWIVNTLSVNNMVSNNPDLRERVLFEDVPEGSDDLPEIIAAMRDSHLIGFTYRQFGEAPKSVTIAPLCVKMFKRRWYVIGKKSGVRAPIKHYSLDRIEDLYTEEETFKYPRNFSPQKFFSDIYGVRHNDFFGFRKCRVVIRVRKLQYPWIEALKLHPSQNKINETDNYVDLEYHLAPNYEFIQELLAQSLHIEVLEPEELREEVALQVREIFERYWE